MKDLRISESPWVWSDYRMDTLKNDFKKYLIDEIRRQSFASYFDAYREAQEFSLTKDFINSFNQWSKIRKTKFTNKKGPSHIFSNYL